jgi:hypothetical protein
MQHINRGETPQYTDGLFNFSLNINPDLNTEPAIPVGHSIFILYHTERERMAALGEPCHYLRRKVNKSKYKTNSFYDWLFQIVYICHCAVGSTLLPTPYFPNGTMKQGRHIFVMDRDFIKVK